MAEKIQAIRVSLNQALNDREKPWKAPLDIVEAKTGVPRQYVFLGKSGVRLLFLFARAFSAHFEKHLSRMRSAAPRIESSPPAAERL